MFLTGPLDLSIALGTWQLDSKDWGELSATEGKAILSTAWDLGFRHFDAAERYGNGRAEQLLGQALSSTIRGQREKIEIATKSEVRRPAPLRRHIELSLRRIGSDYIDLYYIHWTRVGIDLATAVEELARARERGLIRSIGLSNVTMEEYSRAAAITTIDAVQLGYNLIWRRPETTHAALLSSTSRSGPNFVAYSPLAQGLLAHEFPIKPGDLPSDHRRQTPLFSAPYWDSVREFSSVMIAEARRIGLIPAAAALLWLVSKNVVPVVGVHSSDQARDLVKGLGRALQRHSEIDTLLSRLTTMSDALQDGLPQLPNLFGYVPTPCDRRESEINS